MGIDKLRPSDIYVKQSQAVLYNKINEIIDRLNKIEELITPIVYANAGPWNPCRCAPLVGDGSKKCPDCGRLI